MRTTCRAAVSAAALFVMCVWAAADAPDAEIAALVTQGDLPEAARLACEWVEHEPGDLDALRTWGKLSLEVGRKHDAEDALRALIFLTPTDPAAHVLLGEALLADGWYRDAEAEFQAAIALDAASPGGYVGLARAAQHDLRRPDDFAAAADLAVQVAPGYAAAHAVMGAALRDAGDLDGALEALRRALAIDSECAPALFDLGLTLAAAGEPEAARDAWRRYVALRPFTDQAWLLQHNLVVTHADLLGEWIRIAACSPDGTRVAYCDRRGACVYITDARGQPGARQVCRLDWLPGALVWAQDGSAVFTRVEALTRDPATGRMAVTMRLVMIPADGDGEPRVVWEADHLPVLVALPGTERLAIWGDKPGIGDERPGLLSFDPATGEAEPMADVHGDLLWLSLCASPDGIHWAALQRRRDRGGHAEVYDLLCSRGPTFESPRVLLEGMRPHTPCFTPDGSGIVVLRMTQPGWGYEAWVVPVDGSREPIILDRSVWPFTPSFSADGRVMLSMRKQFAARLTLDGVRDE